MKPLYNCAFNKAYLIEVIAWFEIKVHRSQNKLLEVLIVLELT